MDMLIAALLGQILGIVLWTAVLYTPVLQWRTRVRFNWHLPYKRAFLVAIKAAGMALVVSMLLGFVAGATGLLGPGVDGVIFLAGIIAWWYTHTTGVLKESESETLISLRDARFLSAGVMAWSFGIALVIGLTIGLAITLLA